MLQDTSKNYIVVRHDSDVFLCRDHSEQILGYTVK